MNLVFGFKVLSLLVSAVVRLVSEDPAGFIGKVSERFRTSNFPVLSRLATSLLAKYAPGASCARETIEKGELSAGLAMIDQQGDNASKSDRHLAQRTRERVKQLQLAPPAGSSTVSRLSRDHRVLHVLTNSLPYTQSGYTLRSHNVLQSIKDSGIEVRAVTRLGYPVLVGKLPKSKVQTIDGISYERLLPWCYPLSLQERDQLAVEMLVDRGHSFGATILHTTTDFKNAVVTSLAAEKLGIPWVYEIRGELESTWLSRQPVNLQEKAAQSEFYTLTRAQETRFAQSASAVVTLSEISREQFAARGVERDNIYVVPNAISEKFIGRSFEQNAIRRELNLPDTPLIGSVTSVVDYEGLDTLIEALPHLPSDVKALIVGEGTARPSLEELASFLGLSNRVIFVGRKPQSEIWKWYAALDVFVVPRKNTAVCRTVTPIKPLMAQAMGIPVVASDLPALREVTGNMGLYSVAESPSVLAARVRDAMAEPQIGQAGTSWAQSRTWTEITRRYRDVYDGLWEDTEK